MKKFKALFGSKNNKREGEDDIDQVSNKPSTIGSISEHKKQLSTDVWIHIGSFLVAKDINIISQCSSSFHQLYFGQPAPKNFLSKYPSLNDEFYKKDQHYLERKEFASVQELIWKPLVLLYFPKFHMDLHITNWLTLLKRRLRMIIKDHSDLLPLGRSSVYSLRQSRFVENCSFIYKCPMDFSKMQIEDYETRFCNICTSKVYRVDTAEEMKNHAQLGHCVFFSIPPPPPPSTPVMYNNRSTNKPPEYLLMGGPPPPNMYNIIPSPPLLPPNVTPPPLPPNIPPPFQSSNTSQIPSSTASVPPPLRQSVVPNIPPPK